jgi:hypothetical protein
MTDISNRVVITGMTISVGGRAGLGASIDVSSGLARYQGQTYSLNAIAVTPAYGASLPGITISNFTIVGLPGATPDDFRDLGFSIQVASGAVSGMVFSGDGKLIGIATGLAPSIGGSGSVSITSIRLSGQNDPLISTMSGFEPPHTPRCFPPSTLILMADGTQRAIELVEAGDWVWAVNPADPLGPLIRGQVARVFRNITDEFIRLDYLDGGTLSATPGHEMLAVNGTYGRIDKLVQWHGTTEGRVLLAGADGQPRAAHAVRVVYSQMTAHLYPQATADEEGGSRNSDTRDKWSFCLRAA